jgi:hypothetical protein
MGSSDEDGFLLRGWVLLKRMSSSEADGSSEEDVSPERMTPLKRMVLPKRMVSSEEGGFL